MLLDLTGNGLDINPLSSSSKFLETNGDGYQHRTAWAGDGNGVLVIDLGGDGKITEEKEFVFTQWDSGATGDLAALKSAFDTNQNGKLDAGDARWAEFKVMVGDAMISLSDLGIESIDLTPTGAGRVFSDGSAITGTTTFTRTDGTKGEVGDAVLASDAAGYLIKRNSVLNADGSTTTEISGLNKAGVLQFRELVTVSADKSATSTEFDDDGNGSYDRRQTSTLTVGADGARTTVVSNFAKDGSLTNNTTTIRSGDNSTVTTLLDNDGDGLTDERQELVTYSDGSTLVTIAKLSKSGTYLMAIMQTAAADGLTKVTLIDGTGRGIIDLERWETSEINADGSRTTTTLEASVNGTLLSRRIETVSANGQHKTTETDNDGDFYFDERQVITTTVGETSYVTKTEIFNGDGSLRAQSIVTTGKDGLSKIIEYDRDGDGVYEERAEQSLSDIGNGFRKETNTHSAPGQKSTSTKTTIGPDVRLSTHEDDTNGDGVLDRFVVVEKDDLSTKQGIAIVARDGTLVSLEMSTASIDGLSISTSYDLDGDEIFDAVVERNTTAQANGDRKTEIVNRTGSAGQISASTIQTVSADGLTTVLLNDSDGNGVFERSSRDVTVLNADGSRVRRTSIHSADGQKLSGSEATISADRKTSTISEDFDGDGQTDRLQTSVIETDGRRSSTSVLFAGGVAIERTAATRSADGLTSTMELDADGNGTIDLRTLDVTALNADGSRLQTVSARSRDGSLLSTSTLNTSGNGLTKESTVDRNGDGIVDLRTTDVTVLNQNGSKTRTVSNAIDGSLTTTVSGNGLSRTIAVDADGNGSAERSASEVTTFGADLSVTNTVTTTSGSGQLLSRTRTTIAADRNTSNGSVDFDGDGFDDQLTTSQVEANGFTTSSASTYVKTGDLTKLTSRVTTSVSANGLSTSQTVDRDGDGVVDKRVEKVKTLQSDGSVEERFTEFDASGAPTSEVTTKVLRGGVEKLTEWRADGINLSRKATEARVYADDGSVVDTVSIYKGDGALESKTTTSTSGNRRTTVANRDIDGDGTIDQVVRSALQADGSLVTTSEDLATNGIATSARRTVTTSANGLVKTTEFDANGDGLSEQRYQSTIVLNADGGKTESTTEYGANAAAKASHVVEQSGDGLRIQEKWDLNADGTFEKSRTSVTVLNADSSTAETVSEFEGASLAARYTSTSSANGLVRTKQWDVNGDGVVDQSTSDTSTLNLNGTSTRVIQHSNAGTLLSSTTTTTSADGRTVTTQEKRSHAGADVDRTLRSTRDALADGTVIETRTVLNAGGQLKEKQTTTAYGDGRSVKIERDANGDGVIDQTEVQSKAVDGSRKLVVTDFNANGSTAGTTTISTAADGRSTITEWDQDGDGIVDRRRLLTESFNADGSYEGVSVDTKTAGNSVASRNTVKVSADGRTRTVSRDVDGDGTFDVNETSNTDFSGGTVITTTNTAVARSANNLREGDVYWSQAIAAKTELTIASNGLTRTMRSDYDGNGVFEHVGVSQTQIDGSVVTVITERDANGNVIAKGISTVSADGLTTILKKDANADGRDDRIETSVRRADGSLVHTTVENNIDGTLRQTTRNDINALGRLTYGLVTDAQARRIAEHVFRANGSSTRTGYDGATGSVLWTAEFGSNGVQLSAVLLDPLNSNPWVRIEQSFDAAGAKTSEKQFNDNGTTQEHKFNAATGKLSEVQTFAANGALTSKSLFDAQGKLVSAVLYDPLNQNSWARAEQTFDAAGIKTIEKQFNDDGTRTEFYYRSPGGIVFEIHSFAANGALLSKSFHDTAGKKTSAVIYDPANLNAWSRVEQTFDAAGVKTLEKQFRDDGTRVDLYYYSPGGQHYEARFFSAAGVLTSKTEYDALANQTWSRREHLIDLQGRTTQTTIFNDNGTRSTWSYDPASTQIWSTYRQDYNAANQLTFVDQSNDNGTRNTIDYDVGNSQPWSRVERYLDSAGRSLVQTNYDDNGTRHVYSFDPTNAQPWSQYQQSYNAANQLHYIDQTNDNGTHSTINYDVANNQAWSRYEQYWDSSWRLLNQTNYNDNGTKEVSSFDPTNVQTWSSYKQYYNAAGQLLTIDQANDNGTKNVTLYDLDNTQNWWRSERFIDTSGRIQNYIFYLDNGERHVYSLDVANAQGWSQIIQVYNTANQYAYVDQTNDNGTHNTTNYDVGNNQPWSRYEQYFDSSWRLLNQSNYNDNGTRHAYSFDPTNVHAWTRITQVYNTANAVEWQANEWDDGSVETITYNVLNNQPWSKFVQVKNAAGALTTEAAYQGDTARFVKYWDVSNTAPWSYLEQYINAAGQVTAQSQRRDDGKTEETRYNGQGTARQIAAFDRDYYLAMNPDIIPVWGSRPYEHFFNHGWREGRKPNAWFDTSFVLQNNADLRNNGINPFEHWRTAGYLEGRAPHAGYQRFDARFRNDLASIKQIATFDAEFYLAVNPDVAGSRFSAIDHFYRFGWKEGRKPNPWFDTSFVLESNPDLKNNGINPFEHWRLYGYVEGRAPHANYLRPDVRLQSDATGNSPVLLDLNGDSHIDFRPFNVAAFEAGQAPRFDWDDDGIADGTAWVGPADGWLAIDIAADGSAGPDGLINQAKELAFTMWKTPDELAGEQITDLEAVRLVFDTNHNNLLDPGDARWSEFRVWQDANQNGVSDAGELRTLVEADIRLIELMPTSDGARQFADGSAITGTSSYLKGDGSRALVGDATISYRPSHPLTAVA